MTDDFTRATPYRDGRNRRRGRAARRALARTTAAIVQATAQVVSADEPPARRTGVPRADARTEFLLLLVCLIAIGLARSPWSLATALILITALGWIRGALASRPTVRLWLATPLVTAVLVAPSTLAALTPGPTALALPGGLAISTTGLRSAALVVGRTTCSLCLVHAVAGTMPWPRLLGALTRLHLPRVLTAIMAMAHRYILVLARVVLDAAEARRSRTLIYATTSGSIVAGQVAGQVAGHITGHLGGAVLGRSAHLSEEVHDAMIARGFTGRFPSPASRRPSWRDAAACAAVVASTALCVGVDLATRG